MIFNYWMWTVMDGIINGIQYIVFYHHVHDWVNTQCQLPLMLWVRISIRTRCTTLCDKVCQWLATDRWFSLGSPVSSTNKTDRHDITQILLKVALNITNQPNKHVYEINFKKQQQFPLSAPYLKGSLNIIWFYLAFRIKILQWFGGLNLSFQWMNVPFKRRM